MRQPDRALLCGATILTLGASSARAQTPRDAGPLAHAARVGVPYTQPSAVASSTAAWLRLSIDSTSDRPHWDPVVASVVGTLIGFAAGLWIANRGEGPCVATPGGGPCRTIDADSSATLALIGAVIGALGGYLGARLANRSW